MAGVKENTYALTNLARVKMHADITTHEHDAELDLLINETTSRMETYCHRHLLSRVWTHDGTTLPRLDSRGGTSLWLPESPVTAISTLKIYPTYSALTEGYDEDYVYDQGTGRIDLVNGNAFFGSEDKPARGVVEITYTAGFSPGLAAALSQLWGSKDAAADLELACVKQVVWAFHQKDREREGVASRSTEGGTVTYLTDAWLPEVKETLDRYRRMF